MILTILFCDLLWRIKCPRTDFPTASLDITVCQFVSSQVLRVTVRPSDALGLKARVNKKGEFPPGGVGEVPPSIFYVGGNLSTLKIYFSLCVNIFC